MTQIPYYYDDKDRANLNATYGVLPGRTITKDGKPFVSLSKVEGSKESHAAADYFTYVVAARMNAYDALLDALKVCQVRIFKLEGYSPEYTQAGRAITAAEGTALADTPHDGTYDEILLHLRDAVSYIEADCTQRGVPFCFNGARLALNSALLKRETS